jgi:leucyl aminopeptidase
MHPYRVWSPRAGDHIMTVASVSPGSGTSSGSVSNTSFDQGSKTGAIDPRGTHVTVLTSRAERGVDFDPAPSIALVDAVEIAIADAPPAAAAVGIPVPSEGAVPPELGFERAALAAAGFKGDSGQTLMLPQLDRAPLVAVGIGAGPVNVAGIRNAAGAFGRATSGNDHVAIRLPQLPGVDSDLAAQAIVEGILLARYSYETLRRTPQSLPLRQVTIVAEAAQADAAARGAERGRAFAAAGALARDLANSPPALLSAVAFGHIAERAGPDRGLTVELFDKQALADMGCGGLLGVNAGSAEPPVMIKLRYTPASPTGHLTLVGKGIMYDSGGISLKPADGTHATMKNDMSGAGAVFAAMLSLKALGCATAVTGYLMCTDNMPSGTALKMGDVIIVRGGTTVEVTNTDAEGRLVMSDALVLATEEPTDAIIDIATLTGAMLRALGPEVAGVIGNHQGLIDAIRRSAEATDEPVWQLPLDRRYDSYIRSSIADLRNLGGAHAGAISAALFLAEFVGDTPWAHIDIAGTAQADAASSWRAEGCTGFGARLLLDLLLGFTPPIGRGQG